MFIVFIAGAIIFLNIILMSVNKSCCVDCLDWWPKWYAVLLAIPPFGVLALFAHFIVVIVLMMIDSYEEGWLKSYLSKD